jgi:hypothetical protein
MARTVCSATELFRRDPVEDDGVDVRRDHIAERGGGRDERAELLSLVTRFFQIGHHQDDSVVHVAVPRADSAPKKQATTGIRIAMPRP